MPLVLSLRQHDDFYVSDQRFVVSGINDVNFTLEQEASHKSFEITEMEASEIMPDVFVSAGDQFQKGIVRAVIDAPRSILILRGDRYRASQEAEGKNERS